MSDEIKFRLRKSKDGKLYQVIRADGSTRAHFLSLDKKKLPVPVETIRYGRDPHRMAHRAGAFIFGDGDAKYWRQFVALADVDIATAGDSSEEQVLESDERVKDFFAMAVPVRAEDAARAIAHANRERVEAATTVKPSQTKAAAPAASAKS